MRFAENRSKKGLFSKETCENLPALVMCRTACYSWRAWFWSRRRPDPLRSWVRREWPWGWSSPPTRWVRKWRCSEPGPGCTPWQATLRDGWRKTCSSPCWCTPEQNETFVKNSTSIETYNSTLHAIPGCPKLIKCSLILWWKLFPLLIFRATYVFHLAEKQSSEITEFFNLVRWGRQLGPK